MRASAERLSECAMRAEVGVGWCESTGRGCSVCGGAACAGPQGASASGCRGCERASGCVFVSLALAGRQEERRANGRARFHKSWVLIGRQGKGIANKEKSLSGTARSEAPTPPPRPLLWGQRPCPLCLCVSL